MKRAKEEEFSLSGCLTMVFLALVFVSCIRAACGKEEEREPETAPEVKSVPEPAQRPLPAARSEELRYAEMIDRYMQAECFNSYGCDPGLRREGAIKEAAEDLQIHVDTIREKRDLIYRVKKELGETVRRILSVEPELEPSIVPVDDTAYVGTYTVIAEIEIAGCKDDPDLEVKAHAAAERLRDIVEPIADGFKVGVARYRCDRLGTDGLLDVGYLWRQGEEIQQMGHCRGGHAGPAKKVPSDMWCADDWNDGKNVPQVAPWRE